MNEVKLFEKEEFGLIRTVEVGGKPYFVASDVARALGYKDQTNAIKQHCRWVAKHHIPHPQSATKTLEVNVIPQGDVIRLTAKSEVEGAEKFESWIFDEVIPSVLNNGGYIAGQETMTDDELLEKALLVAQRKIEEKNRTIKHQQEELFEKDKMIAVGKPKIEYFEAVLDSRLLVNFRDAGKLLGMSQTQFTGYLAREGFVYKTSKGELRPTEPYRKSDLFQMKQYVSRRSGYSGIQTYLTPKGVQYFKLRIDNSGIDPDILPKHGGRKKK